MYNSFNYLKWITHVIEVEKEQSVPAPKKNFKNSQQWERQRKRDIEISKKWLRSKLRGVLDLWTSSPFYSWGEPKIWPKNSLQNLETDVLSKSPIKHDKSYYLWRIFEIFAKESNRLRNLGQKRCNEWENEERESDLWERENWSAKSHVTAAKLEN